MPSPVLVRVPPVIKAFSYRRKNSNNNNNKHNIFLLFFFSFAKERENFTENRNETHTYRHSPTKQTLTRLNVFKKEVVVLGGWNT